MTVVIEAGKYQAEADRLFAIPMVQSIAANMAIDIHAGKVSLEFLDTFAGMTALNSEFQRLEIPYDTIGGPARAVKRAVEGFLPYI